MSQLDFIKLRLQEKGEVSRNECLRAYIGRTASRLNDLKKLGWIFETETRPTIKPDGSKGKDFVYKLVSKPE